MNLCGVFRVVAIIGGGTDNYGVEAVSTVHDIHPNGEAYLYPVIARSGDDGVVLVRSHQDVIAVRALDQRHWSPSALKFPLWGIGR